MSSPENIFFDLRDLAALGEDAIIGKTVRIRKPGRCRIGAHTIIDDFSYISCGITVGRFTHNGAQAIMIGDSEKDMLTARNAGMFSIGVTYGISPDSLKICPPDVLIDHPGELLEVLGL